MECSLKQSNPPWLSKAGRFQQLTASNLLFELYFDDGSLVWISLFRFLIISRNEKRKENNFPCFFTHFFWLLRLKFRCFSCHKSEQTREEDFENLSSLRAIPAATFFRLWHLQISCGFLEFACFSALKSSSAWTIFGRFLSRFNDCVYAQFIHKTLMLQFRFPILPPRMLPKQAKQKNPTTKRVAET